MENDIEHRRKSLENYDTSLDYRRSFSRLDLRHMEKRSDDTYRCLRTVSHHGLLVTLDDRESAASPTTLPSLASVCP